jgi:hypothetical protein
MSGTTFQVDELSFALPCGFVDQTLNAFVPRDEQHPRSSMTVAREPRSKAPLIEQADGVLHALTTTLPHVKVLGRRSRNLGGLPAYEARLELRQNNLPIHQRLAFVGYYDTLLVFTVNSRQGRDACDQLAERWFDSLRFRKRDR